MKVAVQRIIDRVVGSWICGGLSLIDKFSRQSRDPLPPRKILVVLLSEMGSLVLAYPMFQALENRFPQATVSVLLLDKNREMLEILDVVPRENVLTLNDRSLVHFGWDTVRVVFAMRRSGIDAVIDCELFARVSSIFSFFSGARIRSGFSPFTQEGLYRGSFINRPVLYNPYHHISRQYLTLVEALESSTFPTAKRSTEKDLLRSPIFQPEDREIDAMIARLIGDFPVCSERRLVLIYPGGGLLPIRAWPAEHYCELAEALLEKGYAVGVIGLPEDKSLATDMLDRCNSPYMIDLTGYTRSIRELMLLFHHAVLLVTNDGGPGQFAAMTPIRTIIFYGPETPALYGSHSPNAYFFYTGLSCSPCLTAYNHRNSPCDGDNQCLRQIGPGRVCAKAFEMLAETG
ncbi:MAG: glycosyltransferase family 9 protein [Methylococcales bacterium]|nr:glycosyltransferase family 9 protein [Methylococcales bacterium]